MFSLKVSGKDLAHFRNGRSEESTEERWWGQWRNVRTSLFLSINRWLLAQLTPATDGQIHYSEVRVEESIRKELSLFTAVSSVRPRRWKHSWICVLVGRKQTAKHSLDLWLQTLKRSSYCLLWACPPQFPLIYIVCWAVWAFPLGESWAGFLSLYNFTSLAIGLSPQLSDENG